MIEISFPFGMCLVTFGWLLFRLSAYCKSNLFDWKSEARQLLFLINLLVIVRFTFYPFSEMDGLVQPLIFDAATAYPFRMNLIPFVNLTDYETRFDLLVNLIGNCAMFIPSGILLPVIYPNMKGFRKVALVGFLMSLTIEIIQLPFAVRASDVDDLILNTAGCMIGYGIYSLTRQHKKRNVR